MIKISDSQKHFIKYHLPAILAAITIFTISSIPNLKAPLPNQITFGDKIIHATEYGIFCLLIWWSLAHNSKEKIRNFAPLIAFLIAILWGAFDELYQSTVQGRLSDTFDWLADCIGAGIFQSVIMIKNHKTKSEQPK